MIHFVVVVDSMHIGSACRDGVTRKETPLARFAISFFSLDPLLENRMYVVIYSMCCVHQYENVCMIKGKLLIIIYEEIYKIWFSVDLCLFLVFIKPLIPTSSNHKEGTTRSVWGVCISAGTIFLYALSKILAIY